jgi:hypothetical protein
MIVRALFSLHSHRLLIQLPSDLTSALKETHDYNFYLEHACPFCISHASCLSTIVVILHPFDSDRSASVSHPTSSERPNPFTPIQEIYALPDALPSLCPSPSFFHHERWIFSNQRSTSPVLALNHPVPGLDMTSRRRVGVNRQQWLNMRASHISVDPLSLKSCVVHTMLGRYIHEFTYTFTLKRHR